MEQPIEDLRIAERLADYLDSGTIDGLLTLVRLAKLSTATPGEWDRAVTVSDVLKDLSDHLRNGVKGSVQNEISEDDSFETEHYRYQHRGAYTRVHMKSAEVRKRFPQTQCPDLYREQEIAPQVNIHAVAKRRREVR